jgi:ParB family chromosome partitioning protein
MANITLKLLAADKEVPGVKKKDVYSVDPALLMEEEGFNLRDYDDPEVVEHIEGFAHSYVTGKFVPPLLVRTTPDGRIWVVEGHCRRRGALLARERGAELPFLPALGFTGNDSERVEVMLQSAEGLKLKPLAVALGYLRLKRMGHENPEIAERFRKTGSHVEQMLLLAQANSDVHALVREGRVTATIAIEAVRAHREKAGEFLRAKLEGAGKVTRGTLAGWTPSKKVVTSVIGSVETVVKKLDPATRKRLAEFETMAETHPDQLKGERIEVDAAAFLELVKANAAVSDARLAKKKSEMAAKAKASQQDLGLSGAGEEAGAAARKGKV